MADGAKRSGTEQSFNLTQSPAAHAAYRIIRAEIQDIPVSRRIFIRNNETTVASQEISTGRQQQNLFLPIGVFVDGTIHLPARQPLRGRNARSVCLENPKGLSPGFGLRFNPLAMFNYPL